MAMGWIIPETCEYLMMRRIKGSYKREAKHLSKKEECQNNAVWRKIQSAFAGFKDGESSHKQRNESR